MGLEGVNPPRLRQSRLLFGAGLAILIAIGYMSGVSLLPQGPKQGSPHAVSEHESSHDRNQDAASDGSDGLGSSGQQKASSRKPAGSSERLSGPGFQLIREDGKINREILRLAGIPESRLEEADLLLAQIWTDLSTDLKGRSVILEEESDRDAGILAFKALGSPEVSQRNREAIASTITETFGKGASDRLLQYITDERNFGGVGANDVHVTLKPSSGFGSPATLATYKITDPKTGRVLAKGSTTDPASLKAKFGTAFSPNDQDKP